MDDAAREALARISEAVAVDGIEMTSHCQKRLGERGVLWADLLTVLEQPTEMEDQGLEAHGWEKWRIVGEAADGTCAALVVAIRDDDRVRLITVHWED